MYVVQIKNDNVIFLILLLFLKINFAKSLI